LGELGRFWKRRNEMKYTHHVRRMWEHELIRFMGYIKDEKGEITESGIPRTSHKEALQDAKKMIDELNNL
jgi:protein associated with RNAse G/E